MTSEVSMTMTANGLSQIQKQIMWDRLISVVEEHAQTLLRTAFSTIVREAGDLSAGVFDLKGRMLAQAVTGTPGHVNSMAESVKHFIRHVPLETMRGGDVMEGLYIPMLKLADAGTMNPTLLAMIRANTRLPVDTIGDVYSLVNCNEIGCRRLVEMMDEFGLDDLVALGEHICRHSERAVREEIARLR